jgi:hypothetical protein
MSAAQFLTGFAKNSVRFLDEARGVTADAIDNTHAAANALLTRDKKFHHLTFSRLGKGLLVGGLGIGAVSEFNKDTERAETGTVTPGFNPYPANTYDGQSPQSPYSTGADGNLVFALHNLRHG